MPSKRKRQIPTLREQVFRIGRGVSKILTILPTLATKDEMERRFREVDRRFTDLEHGLNRKLDQKLDKAEFRAELKALTVHFHELFDRHNEIHRRLNERINAIEARI